MKKRYSTIFFASLIASMAMALHSPTEMMAGTSPKQSGRRDTIFKAKSMIERKQTVSELLKKGNSPYDNAVKTYTALTAASAKTLQDNEKLLSSVKVFPSQVTDQISLSFRLSKDTNISVKLMDALGNEVAILLAQRLTAGDHDHSFAIANKLNKGYYFIRVTAGTEQPIIKRIEAL